MKVTFAGTPRQAAGCDSMQVEASTVRELLHVLAPKFGGKVRALAEGKAQLDGSLAILCNGRNIAFLQGLDTPLSKQDEVTMLSQIAGG